MKWISLFVLLCAPLSGQVIQVSAVERATEPLQTCNRDYLLKTLYGPNLEAAGLGPGKYIPTGSSHPFVRAAHAAYCDHRPLVISPDMIWLLVAQGLAQHIFHNSEKYRERLVGFQGKKILEVRRDLFRKGWAGNDWPGVFLEFSQKMDQASKEALGELYAPVFSTTTPEIRTAFRVAHMEACARYFERRLYSSCGIPEITLKGETADWKKILGLLDPVASFHPKWAKDLKFILGHFVRASEGRPKRRFWQSFYKYENWGCSRRGVTGWILYFFPYIPCKAMRLPVLVETTTTEDLPAIGSFGDFPLGRSCVTFQWKYFEQTYPMHFEGGFYGIRQDPSSLSLEAVISWSVINRFVIEEGEVMTPGEERLPIWMVGGMYADATTLLEKAYNARHIRFKCLPTEAMLRAISGLELLETVTLPIACRGACFKALGGIGSLNKVELEHWDIDDRYLVDVESLPSRRFDFRDGFNPRILKHLPPDVETLHFDGTRFNKAMVQTLNRYPLQKLSFTNVDFEGGSLMFLANRWLHTLIIKKPKWPPILDYIGRNLNLRCLQVVRSKLRRLPALFDPQGLRELDLSGNKLSSLPVLPPSLEQIDLADNPLTGTFGLKQPNLVKLNLAKTKVTALDLECPLLEDLNLKGVRLTHLKKISHSVNCLRFSGIRLKSLPALPPKLKWMFIQDFEFNPGDIEKLPRTLEVLRLYRCQLGGANIRPLFHRVGLQSLMCFQDNSLDDDSLPVILEAFRKNPGLSFDIDDSSMSEKGKGKLNRAITLSRN